MFDGVIGLESFGELKFSIVLEENTQIHEKLIVELETFKWDVHLLAIMFVD